jgi:hypothetical protein
MVSVVETFLRFFTASIFYIPFQPRPPLSRSTCVSYQHWQRSESHFLIFFVLGLFRLLLSIATANIPSSWLSPAPCPNWDFVFPAPEAQRRFDGVLTSRPAPTGSPPLLPDDFPRPWQRCPIIPKECVAFCRKCRVSPETLIRHLS